MFAVCVHAILQILKYSPQEARSVLFQYQPSFFLLHDDTLTMVRHLIEEQPVRRKQGDDGHDEAREDKWHGTYFSDIYINLGSAKADAQHPSRFLGERRVARRDGHREYCKWRVIYFIVVYQNQYR